MIKNLKAILSEIRQERQKEFEQYALRYPTSQALEDRRAVLTLELPFKTDTVSILNARAAVYHELEEKRNSLLRIESRSEEVRWEDGSVVIEGHRRQSSSFHTFFSGWINSAKTGTMETRRTIYYIIRNYFDQLPSKKEILSEDIPNLLTMEVISKIIEEVDDIEISTKKNYLSHARNLRKHIVKAYPISPTIISRRGGLSLKDAAQLFEYLEARALRGSDVGKYHDVLLCRALFYAPLPITKLFDLGSPVSGVLKLDGVEYPVPGSFVRLWKGFSLSGRLFLRSFDDKQLHKKIQRLGEYAELEVPSLTPSILRSSAKAICFSHLLLDDSVISLLPRRL